MAETKLVSPLLDGFTLGAPISNHSGICCCPAMKRYSDNKYIVKVIAVPASQVQLDALLVTGAYSDPAAALDYFRQQAEQICEEAALLQKLSQLDGFLAYEGCQMTPMRKNRLGYHIYLLSSYQYSLEKLIRRHPITHLEAVNLGLDICSALSACRQAGYLYADLKPTNIFVGEDKVFRICDLGFVALGSLKFTSMPEKYISPYCPPEVRDAMCTLNNTVDTYALGMILYRIFNNGKLPQAPKDPTQPLPAPAHADADIAEIILKACAPKPEDRWQDPAEMGRALVTYMQKNSVNDVPVAPAQPDSAASQEAVASQETVRFDPSAFAAEASVDVTDGKTILIPVQEVQASQAAASPEPALQEPLEEATEPSPEELEPDTQTEPLEDVLFSTEEDILNILQSLEEPEAPEEQSPAEPEPEEEQPQASFDLDSELHEVSGLIRDTKPTPRKSAVKLVEPTPVVMGKKRGGGKKILITLLLLILLAAIAFCGYCFYHFIYIQTIDDISIEGTQNQITVSIKTEVPDEKLTISCVDIFGNMVQQSVQNGQAVFTDLQPDSLYKISVQISGPYKLTGQTSDVFTTDAQTEIVTFSAITGQEDGSVLLTMTVHGHEPDLWTVTCTSEGEEDIVETFSGHSTTVRGLTVGKDYTITLSTDASIDLRGQNTVQFHASSLIGANNLAVVSRIKGDLTVCWYPPLNHPVENWVVRCYGENYDQTQTVSVTTAVFTKTEDSVEYTIEVLAEGMTQPSRTMVSANPVTVSSFSANAKTPSELEVSWSFEGDAPENGWVLVYTMDNSEMKSTVKSEKPSVVISPYVPGAAYRFTVQTEDETSVFNGVHDYAAPAAENYSGHSISSDKISARLLETPGKEWNVRDVSDSSYKDRFTNVQKISMVLQAEVSFHLDREEIDALFVIRDSNGNVVPNLVEQAHYDWHDLWVDGDYRYAELDIPSTPPLTGTYRLDLYFNGYFVTSASFTIA